jgi:hypothetical protein
VLPTLVGQVKGLDQHGRELADLTRGAVVEFELNNGTGWRAA